MSRPLPSSRPPIIIPYLSYKPEEGDRYIREFIYDFNSNDDAVFIALIAAETMAILSGYTVLNATGGPTVKTNNTHTRMFINTLIELNYLNTFERILNTALLYCSHIDTEELKSSVILYAYGKAFTIQSGVYQEITSCIARHR